MRKLNLLLIVSALLFVVVSCGNMLLDQGNTRHVISSKQQSIKITGDGMLSTRSSDGRVEFAGGYVTGAGMYADDERVTVEAIPYPGYELVSFTGRPVGSNADQYSGSDVYTLDTLNQDWEFIALFKDIFTITVLSDGRGSVSGSGIFVDGQKCIAFAHQDNNMKFEGWYENGTKVSTEESYKFFVDSNRILTGKFERIVTTWEYPFRVYSMGIAINSFYIYLTLKDSSGNTLDNIVINGGGGFSGGGYRDGTYRTNVQSSGDWEISQVIIDSKMYSAYNYFSTSGLNGKFGYSITPIPTGTTNKVGNYYHCLCFSITN